MNDLDLARRVISACDADIAALFEKRMEAVRRVAAYKKERGLPVYDPAREEELLQKNSALVEDPELRAYYITFQRNTMAVSRAFQRKLIDGVRAAFSGIPGAFAEEAAAELFPGGSPIPFPDFAEAYRAAEDGECDCAVLPIENSFAGEVGIVCDLIFSGSLYINNMLDLAVTQNLLALPGTSPEDVKVVLSHPQALAQCAGFLRSHGYQTREAANTAVAAQAVAECGDPSVAAIGTGRAAALYGLNVLLPRINESGLNTTRFAVLSRVPNDGQGHDDDNFFLVFSVKNEAGSLAEAVNNIGRHGYNMRSLHSRPLKTLPWNYYFYVEGEGNIRSENGEAMMCELSAVCDRLKLVGTYPAQRGREDIQ